MTRLLDVLTAENMTYAERARTVTSTTLRYDPHLMFEALEPGLRVHSTFSDYDENYFLLEHPNQSGWSFLTVHAPHDSRGVLHLLSYLGPESLRNHLFEAWIAHHETPQPLSVLFEAVVPDAVDCNLDEDSPSGARVLMLLRAAGAEGDALRTLYALGRWKDLAEVVVDYDRDPLRDEFDNTNITFHP